METTLANSVLTTIWESHQPSEERQKENFLSPHIYPVHIKSWLSNEPMVGKTTLEQELEIRF